MTVFSLAYAKKGGKNHRAHKSVAFVSLLTWGYLYTDKQGGMKIHISFSLTKAFSQRLREGGRNGLREWVLHAKASFRLTFKDS